MTDTPDNLMSVMTDSMSDTPDSLSLAEAAAHLGVSERTILRRIEKGIIQGHKVDAERGQVWRVHLSDMPNMQDKASAVVSDVTDRQPAGTTDTPDSAIEAPPSSPDLMKALEIIETIRREHEESRREHEAKTEQLRQENREELDQLRQEVKELSAAAGHWQARYHDAERRAIYAEEQVKLLMAPKEDEPDEVTPVEPEQPRRSWWRRLLG